MSSTEDRVQQVIRLLKNICEYANNIDEARAALETIDEEVNLALERLDEGIEDFSMDEDDDDDIDEDLLPD